ncbi:alpha-mannosidase [Lachnospiraceae bacterium ASD3451]|uniref:glycoside hydrolase family 38 N-terminal domain-containing protein n=1 Tax=Diplocloster agilis TaxID=2850323 RepID=UPI001D7129CF|nr:alpha-mannosidase [Diplocloster agilis]MBU9746425.1 alpha-mannosidase [Diplocloster agilis]
MKELHLVCNAHIDPCWQWDIEEGIACALSTFRCAADFCEDYHMLIFNHNEALLYQWVERYEPELFERIKKLVAQGRWHIMGGWYLQPDCNLPSGESFVRQILKGRIYFKEKFNVRPKTAINVDSFGHTRGLVQILKKSGYSSYIFCRPFQKNMVLEKDDFIWKGYDGSEVRAFRTYGIYNSLYGTAGKKIREWMKKYPDKETGCVFWGVGDHGGGPSRVDLDDIEKLQSECKDRKIIHSTPEAYFHKLDETQEKLPVWRKGLNHWGPGCYTAMVRLKQKHRQLESQYYMTEKMAVHASIACNMEYPSRIFDDALHALLFAEFHDILPGSAIQTVEETGIRKLEYGLELLRNIRSNCFFRLCQGQPGARDGEIPILVYNPHPYPVEGIFECEFMLANMNVSGTFLNPVVYQGDKRLPSQCEKEESNFPMDWRKKVVFKAILSPGQINRFDCRLEVLESEISRQQLDIALLADKFLKPDDNSEFNTGKLKLPLKMPFGKPAVLPRIHNGYLHFTGNNYQIRINCATGLIDHMSVQGRELFTEPALYPVVMEDTLDSWAAELTSFDQETGRFRLVSPETAARMSGTKQALAPVRIVEDGEVRTVIEASMRFGHSFLVITYKLPKNDRKIEVDVQVCWNEKDKMLKMALPAAFSVNECVAQTSYGSESVMNDGHEAYMQQWCGIYGDGIGIHVLNDGIYGFSCKDNVLYLTLVRSPAYAAHPAPSPVIQCAADYQNIPRMDQGQQLFRFWIMAGDPDDLQEHAGPIAQSLNEKPFALSFFPDGVGVPATPLIRLEAETSILVSAFKKSEDSRHYILRLFESAGIEASAKVVIPGLNINEAVTLQPFEIKTYQCREHTMTACSLLEEEL